MKILPFILALILTGCMNVPPNDVVSFTTRTLGIDISQSPGDGIPHIRLGFTTVQFHRVPTSTNGPIFAPPLSSSISINQRVTSTDINEDYATGDGTKAVNQIDTPAMLGVKRLSPAK